MPRYNLISPLVLISATGTETHSPTLLEFSRFLYHVHLTYEIGRLATDEKYQSIRFPRDTFKPLTSRLQWPDQLKLEGVSHESPWRFRSSLIAVGAAAPALWLFAQTFDMIGNFSLNREKVRAEIHEIQVRTRGEQLSNIEKAEHLGIPLTDEEFEQTLPPTRRKVLTPAESNALRSMLAERDALQYYERSQSTLKSLPFRVGALDITIIHPQVSIHGEK